MRLTERAQRAIKSAVSNHFGEDAQGWLFGSRVDDTRRGGDIDLVVDGPATRSARDDQPLIISNARREGGPL